jgi:hypothetical protein
MENLKSNFAYNQWKMLVKDWINLTIARIPEEAFNLEVSPGKNNGVYILGHLVVSDDDFSVYMGKGDFLFPEYRNLFANGTKCLPPEKYPPVKEILEKWKAVCDKNEKIYQELKDSEFDEFHALCEDPEKDWFKTKERVIQAWQLHQAYHAGQLGILESIVKSNAKSKEQKK